ncbi:MAG: ATP-dependent RecD-like DNA helicase [Clostridia bacterium]|nr:ATP-dependent RecD-like DNA helicase [Clostridia bacterium]
MVKLVGEVEGIIYRNEDTGYTVFVLSADQEFETVTGTFPLIREGDFVELTGEFLLHEVYGKQFKATSYEMVTPKTIDEIEAYLASGIIRGVGPKVARDIVDYFGTKALEIIEHSPEELCLVQGIGKKKAAVIAESFGELLGAQRTVMFLQKYGLTPNMALKIYAFYGDSTISVLQENPYKMVNDIDGIGFLTADKMASSMGVKKDSHFRISACFRHALTEAGSEGHVFLPEEVLLNRAALLLGIDKENIRAHIMQSANEQSIVIRVIQGVRAIYHPAFFYAESMVAGGLLFLEASAKGEKEKRILKEIEAYEQEKKITLAENQRLAASQAVEKGVCVITGGPGTGKTTTLDCILHLFRKRGLSIALCAPTGRAAKRMAIATGEDAKTIHRLLEYSKNESGFAFKRNKEKPVDCDVCIVDEASMIDIFLMQSLLEGLKKGTRLILVGDSDQLPSVGAGNVLGDIIASGVFPTVKLDRIFRQAKESTIVTNAHKINNGLAPEVNVKGGDFFLDRRFSEQEIAKTVVDLCLNRLPKAYGIEPLRDIQVLTPIKKGTCGVFNLNKILQQALNPADKNKPEKVFGEIVFRKGDKVMQIRNNYDLEWKSFDSYGNFVSGTGVFNGDSGIITDIDSASREMTVVFDDEKVCVYSFDILEDLSLAYAISVHKSQGSEFPFVIMPLPQGEVRVMTRNLFYTAVTRASKMVVLCGREESINSMIQNTDTQKRYSDLANKLRTGMEML